MIINFIFFATYGIPVSEIISHGSFHMIRQKILI